MHVRPGQYTSVMQRDATISTKLFEKALKIKWQDKIPDTEVLKKAGMQSMHTVLKLAQLRWTGHVIRMPDERLPKKYKLKLRSIKSSEHINVKGDGPYRGFDY